MLTLIEALALAALLQDPQASAPPTGVTVNNQAVYTYSVKSLPDLGFTYDPKIIQFDKASTAMTETAIGPGPWSFLGSDGKAYDSFLIADRVPFWEYAAYADAKSSKSCSYVLVDGLIPNPYQTVPATGAIPALEFETNASVLRECGHGFEIMSRENYDSVFSPDFESDDLSGNEPPPEFRKDGVPAGLAKDYIDRLIRAYGGKAALQKALDAARTPELFKADSILVSALVGAGLKVPVR